MSTGTASRIDIYTRVTNRIVEELELGVRPRLQPWNAEHSDGRISRPLRHHGEACKGINILMLRERKKGAGVKKFPDVELSIFRMQSVGNEA